MSWKLDDALLPSSRRRQTRLQKGVHEHLRRLERVWLETPIYFVTTCTLGRRPLLASETVAEICVEEWRDARQRHGWAIGKYVIMPDHVHFFCAPERDAKTLSDFVREWKCWTSRRINALRPRPAAAATSVWQREFFDRLLYSDESYAEKWVHARESGASRPGSSS